MKNTIIKFALAVGVIAPAFIAGSAFAATIPATTVFNGQTQVWGNAGQNVQATFRVNIAAGEVVHAIRTQVDGQASICTAVGPFEGAQNVDIPVSLMLPPNSNSVGYSLVADLFTTATVPQAQAMTGNLACTGSYTTAYSQSNVINVLPMSGSGSGSVGGTSSIADQIAAAFTSIKAYIDSKLASGSASTPTVSPLCAEISQYSTGLYVGSSGSQVVSLQGYLLSKDPNSIPLIRDGAAKFGYFGTQTDHAVMTFKSAHSCN